jgi:hypothetical protein
MSAISLITAGVMIAGFAYPPEMTPLTRLEFIRSQMGFADPSGDASDCSAVGTADVS